MRLTAEFVAKVTEQPPHVEFCDTACQRVSHVNNDKFITRFLRIAVTPSYAKKELRARAVDHAQRD